jgi:phage-related protein/predicted XRE-type DNA-binding protein
MADIPEDKSAIKQLRFQGSALEDLRSLPEEVRRDFGHALWQLQNGETPMSASPFELTVANEVMKLSERHDDNTYRCVYAAKFGRAVYVLHVFQKKSKRGIATPKKDIDLVYRRLERAKEDYAATFPSEPTATSATPATHTEFVASCGNVFADLGLENADEELAKAQLAFAIRRRIQTKGLNQTDAAVLLGTDQAKVSLLMNGKIGGFTYDRLLRFLNALDMNVRIIVEPTSDNERGKTLVLTA